jgi:hypothetical protein
MLDLAQQWSVTDPAQECRPPHDAGVRPPGFDETARVTRYLIEPAGCRATEEQRPPDRPAQLDEF